MGLGRVVLLALTALACQCQEPEALLSCDAEGEVSGWLTPDSPSDGVALTSPWAPLVLPIAPAQDDADAVICVDGEVVDQAMPLLRPRMEREGGGHVLIAALEMGGLAPGEHALEVLVRTPSGHLYKSESLFTWDRPPHRLDITVLDGQGEPVAARIAVMEEHGLPVTLGTPDEVADPQARDVGLHSLFVDGQTSVWLPEGDYRFIAVRSILDELSSQELSLHADASLTFELPRVVEAEGLLAADLHVHTGRSVDAIVPDLYRYRSLLAADLDVVVITDHNRVHDPDRSLLELAGEGRGGLRGLPGVEADVRFLEHDGAPDPVLAGHLNAFPVVGTDEALLPETRTSSFALTLDGYRGRQSRSPHPATGEELLIQLNHPRGIGFRPDQDVGAKAWPLFDALDFDPSVPVGEGSNAWMTDPEPGSGTTALDFEAMEVLNRFSLPLYDEVRADWFALLNQGFFITGTGNSDSHALTVELVGFPVNLVEAPAPAWGAPLDASAFIHAVADGRVVVTSGPLPELTVTDGRSEAGLGELLHADGPITAELRVQAPSWVPVHEVRVVVNGEVVHAVERVPTEGEVLDLQLSLPLERSEDFWVLVEAGWPVDEEAEQPNVGDDYGLVAPGYVPLAFTNPVFVDVDNDGVWQPPGL